MYRNKVREKLRRQKLEQQQHKQLHHKVCHISLTNALTCNPQMAVIKKKKFKRKAKPKRLVS